MGEPVRTVELRVLEGPNLYFTRPAIKLRISVPGWIAAPESRLDRLAERVGVRGTPRPGSSGSDQRLRFAARIAAHLTRRVARATSTRLGVRARPGPEADEIVVAFPWRRRSVAEALAHEIAGLMHALLSSRRSPERLIGESALRLKGVEPGEAPSVPEPRIPVVAVTGTNGKTTTVRLLAHLVRSAGMTVAYSSTDGVYRDGELVEAGDYSGFAGAGMALSQPGVDVAVLETARGGILLRGIGTAHNDVAVVTNVAEDHLGLHGIRTLDHLAEVKATITRITRPEGWAVLNADDPRVLGMRRQATGRAWLFTLDHEHPAIRDVLAAGGRAITVLDGSMVILARGGARALSPLIDMPVTIAGISSHNIQNAMAAVAAALGVGLAEESVVAGLRTFVMDADRNPGRANLFLVDGRVVVIDYAHNEAGMAGLTEMCSGLRRRGREIWIAMCTAGDRTDRIIHAFADRAGRGADHVGIAELRGYLRGREAEDIVERLRAGAMDGGIPEVPVYADEVRALEAMLTSSRRGDVVAVTALGQRPEIFEELASRGGKPLSPAKIRTLVRSVRASWAGEPPGRRPAPI